MSSPGSGQPLNFDFMKIRDGGGRHLEKSIKKSRYIGNGLTGLYEIW